MSNYRRSLFLNENLCKAVTHCPRTYLHTNAKRVRPDVLVHHRLFFFGSSISPRKMTFRSNDNQTLMGLYEWIPESTRPEERDDGMGKIVE